MRKSLGDANCDGVLNDADRAALVDELFAPGVSACSTADANRDGVLSVADVMGIALGPRITVVGITSADGRPASPLGFLLDGTPVFFNNSGFGFNVVVEATSGPNGVLVGTSVFDSVAGDPGRRPDLQPLIDRPLGNGSPAVCDESGVPATTPADFSLTQPIADALNDLSCRFLVATAQTGRVRRTLSGRRTFCRPRAGFSSAYLSTAL